MQKKQMTEREIRELIKRIEKGNKQNNSSLNEEYKKQTDRNYKDGDRN